jgi:hypothetical protein
VASVDGRTLTRGITHMDGSVSDSRRRRHRGTPHLRRPAGSWRPSRLKRIACRHPRARRRGLETRGASSLRSSRCCSGVGALALGGFEDAGAVLVRALVGADLLDAGLVGLADDGDRLGDGELVVAGPRLVGLEGGAALDDRRAVLVLALVGVDLGELDLGEAREPARDLLRVERVVAGDREVALGGDRALGAGDARDLAGLA